MFISKWQPPLTAILKILNCNIFNSKNPIFMKFASKCAVFQILSDKIQLNFCVFFHFNKCILKMVCSTAIIIYKFRCILMAGISKYVNNTSVLSIKKSEVDS